MSASSTISSRLNDMALGKNDSGAGSESVVSWGNDGGPRKRPAPGSGGIGTMLGVLLSVRCFSVRAWLCR